MRQSARLAAGPRLVVEYQEGLGGVGTVGLIGKAYHGRDAGFTREVPFCDAEHNNEYKMEWFRRQVHSAGGEVWLGALGCGAVVEGNRVVGALVATPLGRGAVLGRVVIDATGSGMSAWRQAAGGCMDAWKPIWPCRTGLPTRRGQAISTDYLLVDGRPIDTWRALVGGPAALERMRRQAFIRRATPADRWHCARLEDRRPHLPDSIVFSGSDYDSHGYPATVFALIPRRGAQGESPRAGRTCYTPITACARRAGGCHVGLAISMHRGARMVRMQKDMHNQGYAAG